MAEHAKDTALFVEPIVVVKRQAREIVWQFAYPLVAAAGQATARNLPVLCLRWTAGLVICRRHQPKPDADWQQSVRKGGSYRIGLLPIWCESGDMPPSRPQIDRHCAAGVRALPVIS